MESITRKSPSVLFPAELALQLAQLGAALLHGGGSGLQTGGKLLHGLAVLAAAGLLVKCGYTLYQVMFWMLLVRKAYEDPRHTYL